jgi:hypothetical protein
MIDRCLSARIGIPGGEAMLRCPYCFTVIAVTVAILLPSASACEALDLVGGWNSTFVPPGIPVYPGLLGMAGGHLYAAGTRGQDAGPWLVFRWDDRWVEIGTTDGRANAMAEWEGHLLLAGTFTMVNGQPCQRLATWDGSAWSQFGGGVSGAEVRSLLADGDTLYVGGTFTAVDGVPASNVAAWSSGQWSSLGSGLPYTVTGLGRRGDLVVAGQTSTLAPDAGTALQAWDGTGWAQPFPEPPGWADVMVATDDIVAIGYFASDAFLYVLNGQDWIEQVLEDDHIYYTQNYVISAYQDGVVIAYEWGYSGGFSRSLKYWNGTELVDLPAAQVPYGGGVRTMLPLADRLLIAGNFDQVGTTTALHVAGLVDGGVEVFHRPGNGFTLTPTRIAASLDRVVIGAAPLGSTGNARLGMVADWSGHDWHSWQEHAYGNDYDYMYFRDVAVYPTHIGVTWAAGSPFSGGIAYRSYFRLDGVHSHQSEYCEAICYNGSHWVKAFYCPPFITDERWAYVEGIPGHFDDGRIADMISCAQGLAVCGRFENCGDVALSNIAVWDGTSWRDLAGGLTGTVRRLFEWEGRLLAAGSFTIVQTGQPAQVAAWDGQTWEAVLTGADGEANCVVAHRGYLFAGGTFTQVDGRPIRRLAVRDTDGSWWEFGGGANLAVTSLASSTHGLWLIGNFTEVGGIESYHIALWEGDFVAVEVSGFAASWAGSGAAIAWTLSEPLGPGDTLRLERERAGEVQLLREFESGASGLMFSVADPAGAAGDTYQLYRREGGGAARLAAETTLGPRSVIAGGLQLAAPAPNPANPRTTIAFALAAPGRASLVVYDLRGRRLVAVTDEVMSVGTHEVVWDGRDAAGREVPSGTYIVRLNAGGEVRSEKVGLVR